jgi:hypothetical protein
MADIDRLGTEAAPSLRNSRCFHCGAEAIGPARLTTDPRPRIPGWCLCEACWLLLEIGFSDAHPYVDLYQRLAPVHRRVSDAEVHHYILRGWVLLQRSDRLTP